jgi:hypothetical protein
MFDINYFYLYPKRMENLQVTEIFIVTIKSLPSFTIEGLSYSTNKIISFKLFLSREEAQSWVKSKKITDLKTSFRVELLNPKKIINVVYRSGIGGVIEVNLVTPGGSLWNDWKSVNLHYPIQSFENGKLQSQYFQKESSFSFDVPNRLGVIKPAGTAFMILND